MLKLSTGEIKHEHLYGESRFIEKTLHDAGVRSLSVCCAFGVDPDHPLFGKEIPIEIATLCDFLGGQEEAGFFHLGWTNITLMYDYEALKFSFGNDGEIFCEGEESPELQAVRQRWASLYPFPWLPSQP
jgi:hypothetical protein